MLETTYEQYLRLASLLTANDCITDAIEALPVFPLYSFDPESLYGAIDGQIDLDLITREKAILIASSPRWG